MKFDVCQVWWFQSILTKCLLIHLTHHVFMSLLTLDVHLDADDEHGHHGDNCVNNHAKTVVYSVLDYLHIEVLVLV